MEPLEDDSPEPAEPIQSALSRDDILFEQREPQTNVTLALVISDAVEEGRADGELTPSTLATGPLQMVPNQIFPANTPVVCVWAPTVGEGRDGLDDDHYTDSSEEMGPSHTIDFDDNIHLQNREAETNATAAPITAPTVEEGSGDADLAVLDSNIRIHVHRHGPEIIIPMTPGAVPKVEERSSGEELSESA